MRSKVSRMRSRKFRSLRSDPSYEDPARRGYDYGETSIYWVLRKDKLVHVNYYALHGYGPNQRASIQIAGRGLAEMWREIGRYVEQRVPILERCAIKKESPK